MRKKRNATLPFLVFIAFILTFLSKASNENFIKRHNYKVNKIEDTEVKNHDYNLEQLFNEPFNDGNYYVVKAIDISGFQGEIDFNKVKADGYDYVYIRLGSRGYTKGAIYDDTMFDTYYEQARAAGLKVGAYFFSQSISIEEVCEEAFFCDDKLNGRELDLEVVYDFEYIIEAEARTDNLSNELKTEMALAFCQKMESYGYKAMIYANYDQLTNQYDLKQIMNYPIWYAQYGKELPDFEKEFVMWQYTPNGKVDGIIGDVDLNYKVIKIN